MFHGIVLPTLTYYHADSSIDWSSTMLNIEHVIGAGFSWENSCLLVGAAGGDMVMLTTEERIELMRRAACEASAFVPVGASVQDTNVAKMVEMAVEAENCQLDFIQVSPTYYYESSFEDFDRVMQAITEATNDISILVYNVPWENVVDLTYEQIQTLADKYPQFRGLKWSTNRGTDAYLEVIHKMKDRLQIIDNHNMHVMTYLMGGVGHISHFANVYPGLAIRLRNLLLSGNYKAAQEHILKYNQPWREFRIQMWDRSALESPTVKMALSLRGRYGDPNSVRLPSRALSSEETTQLKSLLDSVDAMSFTESQMGAPL